MEGTLSTSGNTGVGVSPYTLYPSGSILNTLGSGVGTAGLTLPDMAFFSVAHQLDSKWQLLGDVSWTGWSSIPKIDVYNVTNNRLGQTLVTDFKDSWRFAAGANYQYSSELKLKTGIAYDKTPVKGANTRLVSLPDNDRTWLSVGAQWKYNTNSFVDVGLARVFIKNADINNDQSADKRGLVNGSYKSSAWLFGLQYSQSF